MPHPPGTFARCLALLLLPVLAGAAQRDHEITVDDYFSISLITDCAISPDGRYAAFVEMRCGEADAPRSTELWVVETGTQRPTRLTFDPANDSAPQWSPDSRQLYFLTKRERAEKKPPYDGTQQVWRLTPDGGEPFAVTRVKGGIRAYQLGPDGRTLYYAREGDEVFDEWQDLRKKYAGIEYGDGPVKHTQLWKLDLETWREEKLLAPDRVILDFKIAPDNSRIALITTPDDRLITKEGQSRVDVYEVATQATTTLPDLLWRAEAPSPYGWLENLAWSSDSTRLAWTVDFDGFPGEILIAHWQEGEPRLWRLQRPDQVSTAGHLHWMPQTTNLCFLADQRARRRVYCVEQVGGGQQGAARVLTPGDVVVQSFSFTAAGGGMAFVQADSRHTGDLYLWTDAAGLTKTDRLTNLNPQVDTWKLPQMSLVSWTAPDGAEVEGVLELPPDYRPEQGPLPLVVELHGGPTDSTLFYLQYWIYGRTLLPARGYALLSPNYRGSTGYGDAFLVQLVGRESDIEVQDILAGVEALVERGIADPQRLGVIGWSNGGFLVNALLTTTEFSGRSAPKFKAASTGAGVVDQVMQWGLEDTPGHVVNYMRGLPWERAEAYVRASAIYRLGQVTTPTLIHVGEKDSRVPAAHCRTLYRGLKEYVGVPTALVVYPGAGHGLTVYNHRKAKMEWDLAWFEKYLPARGEAAAPAR